MEINPAPTQMVMMRVFNQEHRVVRNVKKKEHTGSHYNFLECGHVGCCDSSIGLHGTKHYRETGHPVIMALPDKSCKWCCADKPYI